MRRGSFLFNIVTGIVIAKRYGGIGGFDTSSPPPHSSDQRTGWPSFPSGVDRVYCNQPTDGASVLGGGWRDPPGGGEDTPPVGSRPYEFI